MTQITLHNTKTRQTEVFVPLNPANVRLYLCGPTVYDRAHLGNARPVLVFDVLVRLLRHVYGADAVTYARNFTDVDDKINDRAAATGRSIRDITDETIGWYHADMDALGADRPDLEPRATDWIPAMVEMITGLIDRGHAYATEGHVLFAVDSYADYGALSGRSVEDMIAGARVEVAPFKRNPMDFVLWKPSDTDQPGWDSPWGHGRPGWHIECSAMSYGLLGASFDIHGGGIDLQFPHHENEIAQSCCAHPEASFARYWIHNEMLQVEGRKMSKSLGNFFTVRDLLDQGVPGEVIRLVMLGTHYSRPMDWTEDKRLTAEGALRKWRALTAGAAPGAIDPEVITALADNLNTAGAISALHRLANAGDAGGLLASAQMLGLLQDGMGDWLAASGDDAALVDGLLADRAAAKAARDFAAADAIRDRLVAAGVVLKDKPGGVTEWQIGAGADLSSLKG
ncbi:cysteine--tRNA ligase [Ketogulonicigenium vulgare]|uniref:Cysteine--tRNA ligase n=1 Tax=Ketogulonicigenium vulgare (strain WSH-001) TaxID=759362 RepID=F9Y3Q6_KETVW|nr:cysteine--tRNA ligase [Ketogulonicigenium vulgare]ADO42218.1 cysteinyl-tRNA synthetase [Ketogulonicigenium vulgare Y25]AEM40420.1 Cysteinyl-tRNA synthetase, class Ia [Ketogulonicigenium vulgare WSH-001]ALJ80609.1 cysteine--tRNA ligase [Ketogulonicigenium vulgare]ANW33427.1 cysteine--tRNA ligase [Ketogulonicigenium vulgare]AOZ54135.1 cysteinyl-tRNA synthetase [Ketogulonicigenium vulgare]